jgi:deferrochelatase/peroxidase EfeB
MLLDRSDIQGLVVSGYAAQPASSLLCVRFGGGRPHAWLRRLIPLLTSARRSERFEACRVNVAFSARGLLALGLSEQTLSEFSREFRQGMAARARVLGDVGEDAPEKWELGPAESPIDALLLVYGVDSARLEAKLEQLTDALEQFELSYEEIPTYLDPDRLEHFGFRFGVSQPRFKRLSPRRGRGKRLALGELLLGYKNAAGLRVATPTPPFRASTRDARLHSRDKIDFGHNGTYLVLRQLEQRVASFWASLDQLSRKTGGALGDAAALAERLIGRKPDGSELGPGCPLGAHTRRVNASASPLVRRGRLYGPRTPPITIDDGVARGMMFVALTADIAQAFEFVQKNLINDPKFAGLRDERDPLLGLDDGAGRKITLPGEPLRAVLSLGRRPVRLRGGEYFFMPSFLALGYLSEANDGGRE